LADKDKIEILAINPRRAVLKGGNGANLITLASKDRRVV
jgi:hypothetical protein